MPSSLAAYLASAPSGLYLSLVTNSATAAAGVATEGLTPSAGVSVSIPKLDDGQPGSWFGLVAMAPRYCAVPQVLAAISRSTTTDVCGLYVRIQG